MDRSRLLQVFRFLVNNDFLKDFDFTSGGGGMAEAAHAAAAAATAAAGAVAVGGGGEGGDTAGADIAGADAAAGGVETEETKMTTATATTKKGVSDLWMFPWVDDPEKGGAALKQRLKELAKAPDVQEEEEEEGEAAMQ